MSWGISESTHYSPSGDYKRVTFYLAVPANGRVYQIIEKYGTMSYEEARAISKLLNAVNQGECK
jgi:hypothetical protein